MAQHNLSRPRAVPTDFVEMEHPDVESTLKTSEEGVPHWEERGWKRVSDKSKSSSKKAPSSDAGSEA